MTFAAVKVFPEPVTPRRVCCRSPFSMPPISPSIAFGWSPAGAYSLLILKVAIPLLYRLRYENTKKIRAGHDGPHGSKSLFVPNLFESFVEIFVKLDLF